MGRKTIMSSESSSFQPPTAIPPRTSSAGAADAASTSSSITGKSKMMGIPEVATNGYQTNGVQLQTNTRMTRKHTRNRSSVDGTKYRDGQWSQENEKILLGPYDYMLQHPGKDIRRQLMNAFNAWLKVPPGSLAIITKVIAMLHTSSLL
jgi:geranylgeranyl diphosphate synthase type 3